MCVFHVNHTQSLKYNTRSAVYIMLLSDILGGLLYMPWAVAGQLPVRTLQLYREREKTENMVQCVT